MTTRNYDSDANFLSYYFPTPTPVPLSWLYYYPISLILVLLSSPPLYFYHSLASTA